MSTSPSSYNGAVQQGTNDASAGRPPAQTHTWPSAVRETYETTYAQTKKSS
jgi:hypothetical protein